METPEVEEAKKGSVREVKYLPNVKIDDNDSEPYVIIDMFKGKVRVYINRTKLYRVLHNKNLIQTSFDILLVDSVKKILEDLAKREEQIEKDFKEGGNENGRNIRGPGGTGDSPGESGQGGTPAGSGEPKRDESTRRPFV
jgi:hypothetical protein